MLRYLVMLACCAVAAAVEPDAARPVSIEKIWDAGAHNAFTDIARWRDRWWVTFREADGHVKGDGRIRVITSEDGSAWESAALLEEAGIDLRDPKLSVTPGGRLMIVAGGSVYEGDTLVGRQPRVAFSADGVEWTPTRRVLNEGEWLWRVTWHEGRCYGVAYASKPDDEWALTLYAGENGVDFEKVTEFEVPGRPNETTLRFLPDGRMVALVRREADSRNAWVGHGAPPYTEWVWTELDHRIGGPDFIVLPGGAMWAGGRQYGPDGASTVLARMTTASYAPVYTLPSGGDTSYPGFAWHDGLLWMSYYASHEGKTSIYLAKFRLPE